MDYVSNLRAILVLLVEGLSFLAVLAEYLFTASNFITEYYQACLLAPAIIEQHFANFFSSYYWEQANDLADDIEIFH